MFTFADNLRAFCALRGLKHAEAAEAAGVSEATFSNWATGGFGSVRRSSLGRLCKAFNVPSDGFTSPDRGYAYVLVRLLEANGWDVPSVRLGRLADVNWVLAAYGRLVDSGEWPPAAGGPAGPEPDQEAGPATFHVLADAPYRAVFGP